MSRFVFGLYRDSGAIRVRRAETVTLGRAQEEHTRRVIAAWTAAARPGGDPSPRLAGVRPVTLRAPGPRAWLRGVLRGVRHAR